MNKCSAFHDRSSSTIGLGHGLFQFLFGGKVETGRSVTARRSTAATSALTVEEIRDFEQLKMLEPIWNNLLNQQERPTVFQTYEWLTSWWKCLGGMNKRLCVLVVKDHTEVIGIAPLMEVRETFLGFPVTKIEFISMMRYADSPASCSATLDMIIGSRHSEVIAAMMAYLTRHSRRWQIMRLGPLNENSPTPTLIEREAGQAGYHFTKHEVFTNAYIPTRGTWEDYKMSLPSSVRKNINAQQRKIQTQGTLSYHEFRTPEDIIERYDDIIDIEQRSWKWNIGVSMNSIAFGDFYRTFALEASKKGWLRLWMLKVNDSYVVYDYNVVYEGDLVSLKTSYDESYRKYSPGNLLTWREFEQYFNDGVKRINLLWGDLAAKERWSTEFERHDEIFVCNTTLYSRLIYFVMYTLLLDNVRRRALDYTHRVARKLGLQLKKSELTRIDQL